MAGGTEHIYIYLEVQAARFKIFNMMMIMILPAFRIYLMNATIFRRTG